MEWGMFALILSFLGFFIPSFYLVYKLLKFS